MLPPRKQRGRNRNKITTSASVLVDTREAENADGLERLAVTFMLYEPADHAKLFNLRRSREHRIIGKLVAAVVSARPLVASACRSQEVVQVTRHLGGSHGLSPTPQLLEVRL